MPTTKRKAGATILKHLRKIEKTRSPRSRSADSRQGNKRTVGSTSQRVKTWLKRPGSLDVRGVDTPRKKRTSKRK